MQRYIIKFVRPSTMSVFRMEMSIPQEDDAAAWGEAYAFQSLPGWQCVGWMGVS